MFSWLKRKPEPAPSSAAPPQANTSPLLKDRVLLADWVEEHMILGLPWEENFQLIPDADSQEALDITFQQKERLAKEYHVLRIAGVLAVVRKRFDSGDYEATLNDLAERLANALGLPRAEVGQALDDYVRHTAADAPDKVAQLYLTRMYDDSPRFLQLKAAGIGGIAVDHIATSLEIFQTAVQGRLR